MQRIEIIQYRGKEIIRFDFQGLEEDAEVIDFLDEIRDYMRELNRPTLQLSNITGIYLTPTVMDHVSKVAKEWEHLVIKDAIVGVVGLKKILLQAYNVMVRGKAKGFNSEEAAKEWLVE